MSVQVDGLKEAIKEFKRIEGDMNDLKDAFKSVGEIVAEEARSLAPVRTGKLRAGIKAGRRQNQAIITSGGVFYNKFVHFGTVHIKPNKYMYSAIDNTQNQVVQAFEEQVVGVLNG